MPRPYLTLSGLILFVLTLALPKGGDAANDPSTPQKAVPKLNSHDWPSYNADVLGTRHNSAETTLSAENASKLVEKWRFPPSFSLTFVGVVHATPVVVNGYVYFGTATMPTVYKLTPSGKVKWSFTPKTPKREKTTVAGLPESGFLNSPLVTEDTVYLADVGGMIYALDRKSGKLRWSKDSREKPFPGAHTSNCFFAAPILAAGKLIVAGGGYEHAVAADPRHKCCTGRGFVAALEPATGKVVWKYDVGPEPQPLNPPVKVKYGTTEKTFHFGPSTSSVWSTPSYDATTNLIFFGTDTHNSPRQPTKEDSRLYTKHSCAIIAVNAITGKEKWVTQINKGDVWNYSLKSYDPTTGLYKDQSIGDTPKPFNITVDGKRTRVVGAGCKNGAFYVLDVQTGKILQHTPLYSGPPSREPKPTPDARTLALPGAAGGLQTGCATDGKSIFTNGIDMPLLGVADDFRERFQPPIGGRVVSLSLDTKTENWRHERPKVPAVGGTKDKPAFTNVGDPVGSGIALANGVAYFTTVVSNKLVALDTKSGKVIKEIYLGAVWCGPSISRGRVYVGSGNTLFSPFDPREAYIPKKLTGAVYSFGLPDKDEVEKLGEGDE